jgi:transposase InsO family protein
VRCQHLIELFILSAISFLGRFIKEQARNEWTGISRPAMTEVQTAPGFIIRDNDGAYGEAFTRRLRAMGIRDRPIAFRSPWQNGYVERSIGSIRRECLDHVTIWSEAPSSASPEGIHRILQCDADSSRN